MKNHESNNGVATLDKKETGLQPAKESIGMSVIDLGSGEAFPDMDKATAIPIDLMADYWTPAAVGETKRVLFDRIGTRTVLDQQTQQQIDLECVFFYEKVKGEIKCISNGSKRLVGAIQSNNILQGSALEITYTGKKKNSSNQNMSDSWSIKPLSINI